MKKHLIGSVIAVFFLNTLSVNVFAERKKIHKNSTIEGWYTEGVNYYSNENYHKAIPLFQKVRKSNPKNHDAIYRLALCYEKTRAYTKSIKTLKSLSKNYAKTYPHL